MSKVIVSLLLIIFASIGIIGVSIWLDNQKLVMQEQSLAQIEKFINENAPASGEVVEEDEVVQEVSKDKGNHYGQNK